MSRLQFQALTSVSLLAPELLMHRKDPVETPMRMVRLFVFSLGLALPSLALASPITFVLDHGSVTTKVWLSGSVVAQGSGTLDAGFVTLDTATGEIPDFSLHSSNITIWAPVLPGAYNGLSLDVTISPATGYSSSATGSNPWSVTLGPIDVAYTGVALDVTTPITVPPYAVSGIIPVNSFGVTAYLNQGQMRLGLIGVKVGEIVFGTQVYDVRADIEFIGFAVPEPGLASLAMVAIAALAWRAHRR